jgi:predicted NBD/HSP70 family sugar kinase
MATTGQAAGGEARDTLGQLLAQLHLLGGTASRAELTERLGCGRSVMGYLLGELTDRGVIAIDRAGRTGTGEAGRPSHRVTIADTAPTVVAVQLNIDTATVATVGLGGRVLDRTDVPMRDAPGLDDLLDRICALAVERAGAPRRMVAVGIAVPSPVRRSDGLVYAPLHLGWPSVALRELLTRRFEATTLAGVPLLLGNDANLAALAEHRHGTGRGAAQLLYLTTAHVGLGGALISNGRLFDGAHGYAMEPGHITVDPAGAPCPCGSTGCLEVEADHRGLLRAAGHPTADVHDVARGAAALLAAAETGEAGAVRAVRQVAGRLGSGLASLINLTDPDRIVLAGSLAAYHRLAATAIADNLAGRSFLSHADAIPIRAGALDDAALLGAADLALQPLLDDPRVTLSRLQG